MTGLEIAALVALIASAGVQYKASTDAQERQQQEIQRSLAAQEALQKEAEAKALSTAKTFDPKDRIEEQAAIENAISTELLAPVSESQQIRAQQQTTQGNVSDDYTTAKAKSDVTALKSAEQLARLLGKTTSSNRLRMNEGIRLMDTGQDIDQLNSFSRGQQGADRIAIQQAGNIDPGMVFAGQLLGAAGSAGLAYGGKAGSVTAADTAAANASADPIATLNAAKGWTGAGAGAGGSMAWLNAFRQMGTK
jgi:hypothetical protein